MSAMSGRIAFASESLTIETPGRGTVDVTREVDGVVRGSGIGTGLATVFLHHTSASLVVSENADPEVRRDLDRFLARLVPDGDPLFRHVTEGPDDMPAHVRSVLTSTSIGVPVRKGRLDLGTWQGIFLWEHRRTGQPRRITVSVVGRLREKDPNAGA